MMERPGRDRLIEQREYGIQLQYRKREPVLVWAFRLPSGDWAISLSRGGPVSRVMTDERFHETYELIEAGGVGGVASPDGAG